VAGRAQPRQKLVSVEVFAPAISFDNNEIDRSYTLVRGVSLVAGQALAPATNAIPHITCINHPGVALDAIWTLHSSEPPAAYMGKNRYPNNLRYLL